jgi:hypothetical protein
MRARFVEDSAGLCSNVVSATFTVFAGTDETDTATPVTDTQNGFFERVTRNDECDDA